MSVTTSEEGEYLLRDPATWHEQVHGRDGFCTRMKRLYACHGALEHLKWMHEKCTVEFTAEAMDGAATNGHLHVVKWLHETTSRGGDPMGNSATSFMAVNQLWNVVTVEKCTTAAIDGAATNGHLSVVKWLHKNRAEGCTTVAMDGAARNGHFRVVAWLHCNRQEGCTTAALDGAASGGWLLLVDFLHRERAEGCTTDAMMNAAFNGHVEVVKFLHANLEQHVSYAAITAAARNGHLSIVKYLHENRSERCAVDAIALAITLAWTRRVSTRIRRRWIRGLCRRRRRRGT